MPVLEDIYSDAIKRAKFWRALRNIKRVLKHILKTRIVSTDIQKLTKEVHAELKRQDQLEDVEMQLIAKIIEKCFKIEERNIDIGSLDLSTFITQIEE